MKVVILAGGMGTRISEETVSKPKPMIEIGEMPLLWHLIKYYLSFGHNEFIICAGYKQALIKKFFAELHYSEADTEFSYPENNLKFLSAQTAPFKVTVVDTGLETMTGGRLKRISHLLGNQDFLMTYGDGLSDVDLDALIHFHTKNGKLVTVSGVHPPARFGLLKIDQSGSIQFAEKGSFENDWVNGGFFVINPKALELLQTDSDVWERMPMETLARENQLGVFPHNGFWQPMDTLREKIVLEEYWRSSNPPWKRW